ncbi:MAG: ankyrin repeat domain-containing protein, partial [Burkholderiales bacterium]
AGGAHPAALVGNGIGPVFHRGEGKAIMLWPRAGFVLLLSLFAASLAAEDVARNRVIDEIIELSGLNNTLKEIPTQARTALAQRRDNDAQGAKLGAIFDQAFSQAALHRELAGYLKQHYDAQRFEELAAALHSPLVTRMTDFETQAPTPSSLQTFAASLQTNPPTPQRFELIHGIDDAARVTERALESQLSVIESIFFGAASAPGSGACLTPKQVKQMVDQISVKIDREQYRNGILLTLFYLYRSVPDVELAQYLQLQRSELMHWANSLLFDGFLYAIAHAGRNAGKQIGALALIQHPCEKTSPARAPATTQPQAASAVEPLPTVAVSAAPRTHKYNDLMSAVMEGDRDAVIELLDQGKDVDQRSSTGFTPFLAAVTIGNRDLVKLLWSRGADTTPRGHNGYSALMYARRNNDQEMVRLLTQLGVTP